MNAGKLWPAAIFALLGVAVGANCLLMYHADRDPAAGIEPDYYKKALAWDAHQAAQAASDALGWSVRVNAVPTVAAQLALSVDLADRDGRPVDGADVHAEAFAIARSADRMEVKLDPRAPGSYETSLPRTRPGLWEVRLTARRGEQTFVATERIEVAPGPAS